MTKGIVLLTAGNRYYGELAFNLALSIKDNCDVIPITIIGYGNAIKKCIEYSKNSNIFDSVIEIEEQSVSKLKLSLDILTPYDRTIYLDVDTIWFSSKKISWMFDDLLGVDFTFQSLPITDKYYGERSIMHWAKESEILKTFHTGTSQGSVCKYDGNSFINYTTSEVLEYKYCMNSFIMYFEKTEISRQIFESARNIYDRIVNDDVNIYYVRWGGDVPDELCFSIACHIHNHTPHIMYWQPLCVPRRSLPEYNILQLNYWGMTLPSTKIDYSSVELYINIVKSLYEKYKLDPFLFKYKSYFDNSEEKEIHLIQQYFTSPHDERNGEFMFCLMKNISNPHISKIHLFLEEGSTVQIEHEKIKIIPLIGRASYDQYINYANAELAGKIIVMANTDIYFDNTLDYLKDFKYIDKFFLCLSKWNISIDKEPELSPDHITSQDSWVFLSPLKEFNYNIELGQPGCDCRIAYEAEMSGMITSNPAYLIRSYHMHLTPSTRKWNYYKDMIHGGHLRLHPCKGLDEISLKEFEII